MTQPALPFQYQAEKKDSGLTGFAGLPLYVELAKQSGLFESINQALKTKIRGWTDAEMILSLILLNLAGGDCITDIDRLEKDAGLRSLLMKFSTHGMKQKHDGPLKNDGEVIKAGDYLLLQRFIDICRNSIPLEKKKSVEKAQLLFLNPMLT